MKLLSLVSFVSLVSLFLLSWVSGWNPIIWTLTQYLGPILFLGIWVPFASSFLELEFDSISYKKTLPVMIFGSVLVVFGALLLNTRLMFVLVNAIFNLFNLDSSSDDISAFIVNELLFGIVGPANEEIMKIIPIIVILQASIVFFNPEREDFMEFERKSSIISQRQFGLYGIISGAIFTFLELFLYQWQTIGSGGDNEAIFLQILLRTLAPLHIWATFLIALGIGSFKGRLAEDQDVKIAFFVGLGYFIVGWGFHAFWNTLNVYFAVFLPGEEIILYFILGSLGILINVLLFFGIIILFKNEPLICSYCGYQEKGEHFHFKRISNDFIQKESRLGNLRSILKFFSHLRKKTLTKKLGCPFCQTPMILGTCSKCGARTFVACPHCNGFISESTSICPHCDKKIKSLIDIRTNTLSLAETIIIGVTALTSIAFLLAPLSIILFGQLNGFGDLIIPILLFYFIMSLIAIINIAIALFLNRTSG
ncbi:MAG: PrsW family glutamic-type intramembrane protease, partial [Candidatus Hodarchaeales archaeon]